MGQFALLARSPIGIFVFSEEGDLLNFRLFSVNPQRAFDEFTRFNENTAKEMAKEIKKEIIESDTAYRILRKNFREYAKSLGFVENDIYLNKFLSDFGYLLSKKRLTGLISKDRILVQSVNALDDLHKVISLFQERLYEWFSLHYPELKNSKDLAEKIVTHGKRENFPEFKSSTGIDLTEKDQDILTEFATTIQLLVEEKERFEKYVRETAKEIAPNVSTIVEPILAARLISQAGSLEKMARMPSSTIQLLGAEKALFRHLKKKGKSPKYGILFTSPVIQNASHDNKGKAARILASKLMMAARIDFYSGRHDENIRKQMDEELSRLK